MIYERGEYYSTSTAASENSHGGHPILLENGVHWQWFDSDPGPLSSLAASTFRRTLRTTRSLSSKF